MSTAKRCDGCGQFAPAPVDNRQQVGLPSGWGTVVLEGGYVRAVADFCSPECAADWFLELGQVLAEQEIADPSRFGRPPHEWDVGTWAAFCRQHGVSQGDPLQHVQVEAKKAGAPLPVAKWASLADRPELAEKARRYVLAHSCTLTAKAAS